MESGVATANGDVEHYRRMLRNNGTMPPMSAPEVETVGKPAAKRKKNPQVAGRFADMNAFVDVTMARLTRAEIATWMTMFRFVDAKKNTVAVSVRTIAERSGTTYPHVHKAIRSLIEKGLLERIKTGGINSGSSIYKLHPTVNP